MSNRLRFLSLSFPVLKIYLRKPLSKNTHVEALKNLSDSAHFASFNSEKLKKIEKLFKLTFK